VLKPKERATRGAKAIPKSVLEMAVELRKAILFAILDDYSRLIIHGEFYWDDCLPRLEDSLKKVTLKYGVPEQLYCDNGAVFSSSHLEKVCGKLGVRLLHTRPYRPTE